MSGRIVLLSRRSFLVGLNLSAAGLAVGWDVRADEPSGAAGPHPPVAFRSESHDRDFAPNPFVHIAPDGTVTIVCHRSEMGQGVRSSIPVLIADELGADVARMVVKQADGDVKFGDQNTDGSASIRKFYDTYRQVGAVARMILVAAAAKQWKVKPDSLITKNNRIIQPTTGRTLDFGEVSEIAAKLPLPKPNDVKLRPDSELEHLRNPSLPVLDAPAIVKGSPLYVTDMKLPNMLIAVIARPPVPGGKVAHYDAKAALAIAGVKRVIEMPAAPNRPYGMKPWGGLAILAENTWAAMRGRAALEIRWDSGENANNSSAALREQLLVSAHAPGTTRRNVGDVNAAFARAARTVEADYYVPHLAHLAMEPLAALARVADGRCEIWAPTQHPQACQAQAAQTLEMAPENVTVHVMLLGGAFGRKSKADFTNEAAYLARATGVPVRVQWTREDDVRHDYYNTVALLHLKAGFDERGKLLAWLHRSAFPPIDWTFKGKELADNNDLQQGVLDFAVNAPNVRAEACSAKGQVRIGWYRSVYNIFQAFAIGSFMDEIASARGMDPRDNWLDVIGPARKMSLEDLGVDELVNYGESLERHPVDAGRLRGVIERVTAASRFSSQRKAGRALGLAAHRSFVAYTAVVVSVVPDERNKIRVDEAWISMDSGLVVNQERVRAQMAGAVIMGISNALFGGITIKNGATEQSNFHDMRIVRMNEAPRHVHVDLVPSREAPCGVGEPGVPPVAPAVANAVFALTGRRIRELPLVRAL